MMNAFMFRILCSLMLVSFTGNLVWSQETSEPITIGKKLTMNSKLLEEDRELWIWTPPDYEEKQDSFGVIFLLDGPWNFHHTSATAQFLSRNGRMPEMIIVGIANTDRTRDLTPKNLSDTTGRFPTSGGADRFLDFMEQELIPHVDATFRTREYRVLIGHSFGGLFVNHTIVHRPHLFNDYLSISPSLWWDDQRLVEQTRTYFQENEGIKGYLYMTMGNEGGNMLGGAWKMSAVLEESAPEEFVWAFDLMEEETHGSVPSRSTYKGFEFIFQDWYLPEPMKLFETGGLAALDAHYEKISKRWGYKLNPPENTINQIGYALLRKDEIDQAIDVFQRNVKIYPNSSNVYDSLGEALKKKGNHKESITNYKKSLDLNPGNENAKKMLAEMGVNVADLSNDLALPVEVLERYVGTYETPEFTVKVYRENKSLFGQPSGQPAAELFAVSETEFYTKMVEARVIFGRDEHGETTTITIKMNGVDMIGNKVK